MFDLFNKNCIALTWDEAGACRGVRMIRQGTRYSVVSYWQSSAVPEDNISSVLAQGLQELGGDEDIPVIVGSTGYEFCFTDLSMPDLDIENLRNALRFELTKQAPLRDDKLVWGFRKIGSTNKKQIIIRLAYLRETQWGHILDRLGELAGNIDAFIPPPAALDPILEGTALYIQSGKEKGNDYLYVPENERRELLYPDPEEQVNINAFGAGNTPLALDGFNPGDLSELAPEEQRSFAGAAVLAMYGSSAALGKDKKTWLTLPEGMRPRRHIASRRTAAILGIYLGLILVSGLAYRYIKSAQYLNDLQTREAEISKQIENLENREGARQFISSFQEELAEVNLDHPSLLQCLIDLTKNIPNEYWVSNFNWKNGDIELQIQSEKDDLTFLEKIRESPLLTDVVTIRKTVDHENKVTFQVRMRAVAGD